jgi:hypothetical protein
MPANCGWSSGKKLFAAAHDSDRAAERIGKLDCLLLCTGRPSTTINVIAGF